MSKTIGIKCTEAEYEAIINRFGKPINIKLYLLNEATVKQLNNGDLIKRIEILEAFMNKKTSKKSKTEKKETTEVKELIYPFPTKDFKEAWDKWISYKWNELKEKYKLLSTEQVAINRLAKDANNDENYAIEMIDYAISKTRSGLFPIVIYGNTNTETKSVVTAGVVIKLIIELFGAQPTEYFLKSLQGWEMHDQMVKSEKAARYHLSMLAKDSGKDFSVALATINKTITTPDIINKKASEQNLMAVIHKKRNEK